MFYNKISNWSNVFETIQNINIDTTPFIKTLTKRRGRASVYLIRNGIQLQNLIYIGVTKDIKRRFREGHLTHNQFDLRENLEKATLIEKIETDKALLLESLLILSDNNTNLINSYQEYNNFLIFIQFTPSGIEEQVDRLHKLAVRVLYEKWNTLTWLPFKKN
uniref:GIY-YIG domain-containing protein n=1 Tax=Meloidogyne floridensis TaxID=298350 RepID=A0A915NLU9_9BILA